METVEDGEQPNVLREIASDEELEQIPKELAKKIHAHFNAKFDEFITAKAVFETSRKTLGKLDAGYGYYLYSNVYSHDTLVLFTLSLRTVF